MDNPAKDLFQVAVEFVLSKEGGLHEETGDPGGLTNWGLSQRSYPHLDLRNTTREQAVAIYEHDFWLLPNCWRLPDPLAVAVFDGCVNNGPETSVKILQKTLGLTPDGIIGDVTAFAALKSDVESTLVDYLARRAIYYSGLQNFPQDGRGWMSRLFWLHAFCCTLRGKESRQ